VIPKKIRENFKTIKGVKLLVTKDKGKIILKPIKLSESHMLILLSEPALKKTWNNKYNEQWDDVL